MCYQFDVLIWIWIIWPCWIFDFEWRHIDINSYASNCKWLSDTSKQVKFKIDSNKIHLLQQILQDNKTDINKKEISKLMITPTAIIFPKSITG